MANKYRKSSVFFHRGVIFAVLVSFISSDVAILAQVPPAGPLQGKSIPRHGTGIVNPEEWVDSLKVPEELGRIQEKFIGAPSRLPVDSRKKSVPGSDAPPPFVVYLQVAHAHFESETHIRGLIEFFKNKARIPLVLLEGGEGRLDSLFFKAFPDRRLKEKVVNHYLKAGDITGGEAASILEEDHDTNYYGVDDERLYLENRRAFIQAKRIEKSLLRKINRRESALNVKGLQILTPEAARYHKKNTAFHKDALNLFSYVAFLRKIFVQSEQGRPLKAAGVNFRNKFPGLDKILQLGKEDSSAGSLCRPLPAHRLRELETRILPSLSRNERIAGGRLLQDYKTGGTSCGGLIQSLHELSRNTVLKGFLDESLQGLPRPAAHFSNLTGTKLFEEIKALENHFENSLPRASPERLLLGEFKRLRFLGRLARLELIPEDLDAVSMMSRSQRTLFRSHLMFYELAQDRDQALFANVMRLARKEKAPGVILVTGGFHAPGITRRLKEKGIPFVLVASAANDVHAGSNYAEILQGKVSYRKDRELSLWEALARDYAEKLAASLNSFEFFPVFKHWRDRVIQQSFAQGRLTQAGVYTKNIDALIQKAVNAQKSEESPPASAAANRPGRRSDDPIQRRLGEKLDAFVPLYFNRRKALVNRKLAHLAAGLKEMSVTGNFHPQALGQLFEAMKQKAYASSLSQKLALIRRPRISMGRLESARVVGRRAELRHHDSAADVNLGKEFQPAPPAAPPIPGVSKKLYLEFIRRLRNADYKPREEDWQLLKKAFSDNQLAGLAIQLSVRAAESSSLSRLIFQERLEKVKAILRQRLKRPMDPENRPSGPRGEIRGLPKTPDPLKERALAYARKFVSNLPKYLHRRGAHDAEGFQFHEEIDPSDAHVIYPIIDGFGMPIYFATVFYREPSGQTQYDFVFYATQEKLFLKLYGISSGQGGRTDIKVFDYLISKIPREKRHIFEILYEELSEGISLEKLPAARSENREESPDEEEFSGDADFMIFLREVLDEKKRTSRNPGEWVSFYRRFIRAMEDDLKKDYGVGKGRAARMAALRKFSMSESGSKGNLKATLDNLNRRYLQYRELSGSTKRQSAFLIKSLVLPMASQALRVLAGEEAGRDLPRTAYPDSKLPPEAYLEAFQNWQFSMNLKENFLLEPGYIVPGTFQGEIASIDQKMPVAISPVLAARQAGFEPAIRSFPELARAIVKKGVERIEIIPSHPEVPHISPPALWIQFSEPLVSLVKEEYSSLAVIVHKEAWPPLPEQGIREEMSKIEFSEETLHSLDITFHEESPFEEKWTKLKRLLELAIEGRLLARADYGYFSPQSLKRVASFIGRTPFEREAIEFDLGVLLERDALIGRDPGQPFNREKAGPREAAELRREFEKKKSLAVELLSFGALHLLEVPGAGQRMNVMHGKGKEGIQKLQKAFLYRPLVQLLLARSNDEWVISEQDIGTLVRRLNETAPVLIESLPEVEKLLAAAEDPEIEKIVLIELLQAIFLALPYKPRRSLREGYPEVDHAQFQLMEITSKIFAEAPAYNRSPAYLKLKVKGREETAEKIMQVREKLWEVLNRDLKEPASAAMTTLVSQLDARGFLPPAEKAPPVQLKSREEYEKSVLSLYEWVLGFFKQSQAGLKLYASLVTLRRQAEMGELLEALSMISEIHRAWPEEEKRKAADFKERLLSKMAAPALADFPGEEDPDRKYEMLEDIAGQILAGGMDTDRPGDLQRSVAEKYTDHLLQRIEKLSKDTDFEGVMAKLTRAREILKGFPEFYDLVTAEAVRIRKIEEEQKRQEREERERQSPAYRTKAIEILGKARSDYKKEWLDDHNRHMRRLVEAIAEKSHAPLETVAKVTQHLHHLKKKNSLTGFYGAIDSLIELLPPAVTAEGDGRSELRDSGFKGRWVRVDHDGPFLSVDQDMAARWLDVLREKLGAGPQPVVIRDEIIFSYPGHRHPPLFFSFEFNARQGELQFILYQGRENKTPLGPRIVIPLGADDQRIPFYAYEDPEGRQRKIPMGSIPPTLFPKKNGQIHFDYIYDSGSAIVQELLGRDLMLLLLQGKKNFQLRNFYFLGIDDISKNAAGQRHAFAYPAFGGNSVLALGRHVGRDSNGKKFDRRLADFIILDRTGKENRWMQLLFKGMFAGFAGLFLRSSYWFSKGSILAVGEFGMHTKEELYSKWNNTVSAFTNIAAPDGTTHFFTNEIQSSGPRTKGDHAGKREWFARQTLRFMRGIHDFVITEFKWNRSERYGLDRNGGFRLKRIELKPTTMISKGLPGFLGRFHRALAHSRPEFRGRPLKGSRMPLNIDVKEPLSYFLRSIGVDPRAAVLTPLSSGFSISPVERSSAARLLSVLRREAWTGRPSGQDPAVRVVLYERTPILLLFEFSPSRFIGVDLLAHFQSMPDKTIEYLKINQNFFNRHFRNYAPLISGNAGPFVQYHVHPVSEETLLSWHDLRIEGYPTLRLPVFLDVFPPSAPFNEYVSELLKSTVSEIKDANRILVLDSGSGPEAVWLAALFRSMQKKVMIDAVDLGNLEVANTRASAAYHDLSASVRAFQSDGYSRVRGRYDYIFANPPFPINKQMHPSDPRTEDPEGRHLAEILAGLKDHLRPGGALYIVLPRGIFPPDSNQLFLRGTRFFYRPLIERGEGDDPFKFAVYEIKLLAEGVFSGIRSELRVEKKQARLPVSVSWNEPDKKWLIRAGGKVYAKVSQSADKKETVIDAWQTWLRDSSRRVQRFETVRVTSALDFSEKLNTLRFEIGEGDVNIPVTFRAPSVGNTGEVVFVLSEASKKKGKRDLIFRANTYQTPWDDPRKIAEAFREAFVETLTHHKTEVERWLSRSEARQARLWRAENPETGNTEGYVYLAAEYPALFQMLPGLALSYAYKSFKWSWLGDLYQKWLRSSGVMRRAWEDFHQRAFEFPRLLKLAAAEKRALVLVVPEKLDEKGPLDLWAPWLEGARVAMTWASAFYRFKELGNVDVKILRLAPHELLDKENWMAGIHHLWKLPSEDSGAPEENIKKREFGLKDLPARGLSRSNLIFHPADEAELGLLDSRDSEVRDPNLIHPPELREGQKRAVVTGGAGFIGSHLAEELLKRNYQVIVLDNLASSKSENLSGVRLDPAFFYEHWDVTKPFDILGPVHAVIHLASRPSPADYYRHPEATLLAGLEGTRRTLELATAKGARYLLASTSEVYGDPEVNPQPESYPGKVNPTGKRSAYDESKRGAETLSLLYHARYGLDVRMARIFNTYGPRMRLNDGRVVTEFIQAVLENRPMKLFGGGHQTRSFGFVDDTVSGLLALLETDGISGQTLMEDRVFNIGNPGEFTVGELAEKINALAEKHGLPAVPVHAVPQPDRDDPKKRRPDIARSRKLLNYQPKTPLDEGLEKTFVYFKQQHQEKMRAEERTKSGIRIVSREELMRFLNAELKRLESDPLWLQSYLGDKVGADTEARSHQKETHERILKAFQAVPRDFFVPDASKVWSFRDWILPIGHGQTLSQPSVVSHMLALAGPNLRGKVLDIGSGSGYTSALLSRLADRVYGVEIVPELAGRSRQALKELGIENAEIYTADAAGELPPEIPDNVDLIFVSAEATRVPENFARLLAPGGALIIPVYGRLMRYEKDETGGLKQRSRAPLMYQFVEFVGANRKAHLTALHLRHLWRGGRMNPNGALLQKAMDEYNLEFDQDFWKDLAQVNGDDEQIEKLEKAIRLFRNRQSDAPGMARESPPVEREPPARAEQRGERETESPIRGRQNMRRRAVDKLAFFYARQGVLDAGLFIRAPEFRLGNDDPFLEYVRRSENTRLFVRRFTRRVRFHAARIIRKEFLAARNRLRQAKARKQAVRIILSELISRRSTGDDPEEFWNIFNRAAGLTPIRPSDSQKALKWTEALSAMDRLRPRKTADPRRPFDGAAFPDAKEMEEARLILDLIGAIDRETVVEIRLPESLEQESDSTRRIRLSSFLRSIQDLERLNAHLDFRLIVSSREQKLFMQQLGSASGRMMILTEAERRRRGRRHFSAQDLMITDDDSVLSEKKWEDGGPFIFHAGNYKGGLPVQWSGPEAVTLEQMTIAALSLLSAEKIRGLLPDAEKSHLYFAENRDALFRLEAAIHRLALEAGQRAMVARSA